MKKLNYYTSLADLPILNWVLLHQKQDVRHLLYDFNSKHEKIELQRTYKDLLYQFKDLKLPLLKAKAAIASRIIDLVLEISTNSKDVEKLEKASIILRALLVSDNPDIDFIYKVDFTETAVQRGLLTRLAIKIKEYEAKKGVIDNRPEQSIYEKASAMSELMGFRIDVKTCPVLEFKAHEEFCINKIKYVTNGNDR